MERMLFFKKYRQIIIFLHLNLEFVYFFIYFVATIYVESSVF